MDRRASGTGRGRSNKDETGSSIHQPIASSNATMRPDPMGRNGAGTTAITGAVGVPAGVLVASVGHGVVEVSEEEEAAAEHRVFHSATSF